MEGHGPSQNTCKRTQSCCKGVAALNLCLLSARMISSCRRKNANKHLDKSVDMKAVKLDSADQSKETKH